MQSKKFVIIDPNPKFASAIRNSVNNLNSLSNINLQADSLIQDVQNLNAVINILLDLTNKSDIDFQNSIRLEQAAVDVLYATANGMRYNALAQEMINRYIVDLQIDYGNYIEATLKNQNPQLTMHVLNDSDREFRINCILQFFKKDYDKYSAWLNQNKDRINKMCTRYQQQITGLIDAFSELHAQCKNYKSILNSNYKSAEKWLRYIRLIDETKAVNEERHAVFLALDSLGKASGNTLDAFGRSMTTDFSKSMLSKKRARAKDVLDKEAVALMNKYQNEITQADEDVIQYIFDYIRLVSFWNKNINSYKVDKVRAALENKMQNQYTIAKNNYLQLLLKMQLRHQEMQRDVDIQTDVVNGPNTFITVWVAAYLCYQNSVDHSLVHMQQDLDVLFWLIIQDLAVDHTYRGKTDKSKNLCFYEGIKRLSNNIYCTNFRNRKETKNTIDVSRYIIDNSTGDTSSEQ